MAAEWLEADAYTVRRLAAMHDWIFRGEGTGALAREARLLEDAFGLSPYGRRCLEWTVAEEPTEQAAVTAGAPQRLRAVER